MYKELFEKVVQEFSEGKFERELEQARKEYSHKAGRVFEDEDSYEVRTHAFFEWYVLDRDLYDYGIPPIRIFGRVHTGSLREVDATILRSWENTERGVYLYVDRSGDQFRVRNILTQKEFSVTERRAYPGISKGDLFDARILRVDEKPFFTDSVTLHPNAAKKYIDAMAKENPQIANSPIPFLIDLSYLRLQLERFSHLSAEEIYSNEMLKNRNRTDGQEGKGHAKAHRS